MSAVGLRNPEVKERDKPRSRNGGWSSPMLFPRTKPGGPFDVSRTRPGGEGDEAWFLLTPLRRFTVLAFDVSAEPSSGNAQFRIATAITKVANPMAAMSNRS